MTEVPIKRTVEQWDAFFYAMALHVATQSKDPDRKVGAVLVTPDRRQLSFGYNGFPEDVPDLPSMLTNRALKSSLMQHAEENCMQQCPFEQAGCTLYVTRFPCYACATRLVHAGIRKVVCPPADILHPRWGRNWYEAAGLLQQCDVRVQRAEGVRGEVTPGTVSSAAALPPRPQGETPMSETTPALDPVPLPKPEPEPEPALPPEPEPPADA